MRVPVEQTTADRSTAAASCVDTPASSSPPLPLLTVLSHPDLTRVGDRVFLGSLNRNQEVHLSRTTPYFFSTGSSESRPLGDLHLSRKPLRLAPRIGGGIVVHRDLNPIPVTLDGIALERRHEVDNDALEAGVVMVLRQRVALLLHQSVPPGPEIPDSYGLVGESEGLVRVRKAIERVAGVEIPVLITGETGTGKELVAQALHKASPRRDGPFLAVSLAALPTSLAAAELFGARRGAYTGAVRDQPGYFGQADGGTLFLDEIGETSQEIQGMLLRALETGEIVPVGAQAPRRVDVRVIAATDADLDELIASGVFKAPLLHRLAGYRIHLPPLRRRRDDLGRLLVHILRRERERIDGTVTTSADTREPRPSAALMDRLVHYHWPGNVRQLANVARQLVIESRGRTVLGVTSDLDRLLPESVSMAGGVVEASKPAAAAATRRQPSQIPEDEILAALRESRWEIKATAERLGIPRTSLYPLLERSSRLRLAAEIPEAELRRAFQRCDGKIEAMVEDLEISRRALIRRLVDLGLR